MAKFVRRLRTNPRLAGNSCSWCNEPLYLGGDAALCEACDNSHHAVCWDKNQGCGQSGCVNAPLQELQTMDGEGQTLLPDEKLCPHCYRPISVNQEICEHCHGITRPDGVYRGQKTEAPGVQKAFIQSIVGLFFFGIILGPLAIRNARAAQKLMAENPALGGERKASIAIVIGHLDWIGFVLIILARVFDLNI